MNLAGSYGSYDFGPGSGKAAVNGVTGLEDGLPRGANTDRPLRLGVSRGLDLRQARVITYRFAIFAATVDAYETAKDAFRTAFAEGGPEQELLFDDSEKLVWAYVDSLIVPVDAEVNQRHTIAEVVLVAPDPRIYEAEATVVVDDNVTLTVAGTRDTRAWRVDVEGPCTGVTVAFGTGVDTVTIDLPDVTVPSGWTLVVDAHEGPRGVVYLVEDGEDVLPSDYISATAVDADGRLARILPMPAGSVPAVVTAATGTPTVTWTYRGAM